MRSLRTSLRHRASGAALALALAMAVVPVGAQVALAATPSTLVERSQHLSDQDRKALSDAFEAAERNRAQTFEAAKASVRSALGRTLAEWKWLVEAGDGASFDRLDAFLSAYPSWPRVDAFEALAERKIADGRAPQEIVAWFARHEPTTGEGSLAYAEALKALGRDAEAKTYLVKAWVELGVPDDREAEVLSRYGSLLSRADHEARLERLLYDGYTVAAQRMLAKVGPTARALAEARIALQRMAPGVDGTLARVPEEASDDPGLALDRIRWRRRQGRDEECWPLLKTSPDMARSLPYPELWWTERHIQARNALKEKKYDVAYAMVANHGLTEGASFADAEWLAGWIALRYLEKPQRALEHFLTLEKGVSTPISKARAYYWAGRAADAAGDGATALAYYHSAGERPFTYYGQLALERLNRDEAVVSLESAPQVSEAETRAFLDRPEIAAFALLNEIGSDRDMRRFAFEIGDRLSTPAEHRLLSNLLFDLEVPHLSVRVAKMGLGKHFPLVDEAYPLVTLEDKNPNREPEAALVLGLSRQESEFNPKAVSSAGARGLMQLMPATAKLTAKKHGLTYQPEWLISKPAYNTTLGRAHLGDLLDEFGGSYILTIAAYNAGGRRVKEWLNTYGDPRAPGVDAVDWVELIPFSETRNYVQRVIENTSVYRSRLAGKPTTVSILADLQRGSTKPRPTYAARRDEQPQAATRLASLTPPAVAIAAQPALDPVREPPRKTAEAGRGGAESPVFAPTPRAKPVSVAPRRVASRAPGPFLPPTPAPQPRRASVPVPKASPVAAGAVLPYLDEAVSFITDTIERPALVGDSAPTVIVPLAPPSLPKPAAPAAPNVSNEGAAPGLPDAPAAAGGADAGRELQRVPEGCERYVVTPDGSGRCADPGSKDPSAEDRGPA